MNAQRGGWRPAMAVLMLRLCAGSASGAVVEELDVPSQMLERVNRTIVAIPEAGGIDCPAIYMLHGYGGNQQQWRDDAVLGPLADRYGVVLVLPDGGHNGWWLDSPVRAHRGYETHVVYALASFIERRFGARPGRSARALVGLSMGGHGAITLALKHPDRYCAAASLSGVLDLERHPEEWELAAQLGPMAESRPAWRQNSARWLVERLPALFAADLAPALSLSCGTSDFAFQENEEVHRRLVELEVPHAYETPEGGHDHGYWKARVETQIRFLMQHLE